MSRGICNDLSLTNLNKAFAYVRNFVRGYLKISNICRTSMEGDMRYAWVRWQAHMMKMHRPQAQGVGVGRLDWHMKR